MLRGLVVLLIVLLGVGAACASPPDTPTIFKDIVVAVGPNGGAFTPQYSDGNRPTRRADPAFLRDLRVGEPVQAVAEGTTVRLLAQPGAPGPEAQEGRRSS